MNCECVKSVIYVLITFHNVLLLPDAWKINYNLLQVYSTQNKVLNIPEKHKTMC